MSVMARARVQSKKTGDEQPVVLVSFVNERANLKKDCVSLIREHGWRPLDLSLYMGGMPEHSLQWALVDTAPDHPSVNDLRRMGCQVVRLGRDEHPLDKEVPALLPDKRAAGRLAAEHFAERNFKHVGFVGYAPMTDWRVMYEAFRERALELGAESHLLEFLPFNEENRHPRVANEKARRDEFAEWIGVASKPMGIFTFGPNLAGRLIVAALHVGLSVPADVAILAYGNKVADCMSAPVPLSAIDSDQGQAQVAVSILADLISGKSAPSGAVFLQPKGVVVRESTDVLASADPIVAQAVRYMWDHLAETLSVDDIAEAVGNPRRKLERAFRREIGHGINAELRRRRLESCCELLRTTELSITEISPMIGFPNKDYLHAIFRKTYGVTPRKWRMSSFG